jgi:hypothetical protein
MKLVAYAITCAYTPEAKPPTPEIFAFIHKGDAEDWMHRLKREPKLYRDVSKVFPIYRGEPKL